MGLVVFAIGRAIISCLLADKKKIVKGIIMDESQEVAGDEIDTSAFEELLGGGLEHEVAAIGGFSATMFLQVAKRQLAMLETLNDLVPGFGESFQLNLDKPETLVQTASMVGGIIEGCVDDDTPEDSMLLQVLDHCAALVEQGQG